MAGLTIETEAEHQTDGDHFLLIIEKQSRDILELNRKLKSAEKRAAKYRARADVLDDLMDRVMISFTDDDTQELQAAIEAYMEL